MKRIPLKFTAVVAMTVICLFACKKDPAPLSVIDIPVKPDTSRVYLPLRIQGTSFTISYSYDVHDPDTLRAVTKKYAYEDSTYSIVYDLNRPLFFTFIVNGLPVSQTVYTLGANAEVIRGDVYHAVSAGDWGEIERTTLKSYYTLTYNSANQISKISYFHADGQKDHDKLFDYTAGGNISGVNSSINTYLEYDNFSGFARFVKNAHLFYAEGADQLLFYRKNNPVKLNGVSRNYKYNHDHYPVEMTVHNSNVPEVFKIVYIVK